MFSPATPEVEMSISLLFFGHSAQRGCLKPLTGVVLFVYDVNTNYALTSKLAFSYS